jgi:Ca-activated chloride channel homolog
MCFHRAAVLWAVVLSFAAAGGAVLSAICGQTFTSRVEAVRLDVLVTSAGQPVLGLQARDFEIRDNGVLQQVDIVSFEEVPLSVVLALDMSDSVTDEGLAHLQHAGRAVLEGLASEDRAGLITFSHAISQPNRLSSDLSRARAALEAARPAGDTALVDASHAAMTLAASPGSRGLVVIFTDGLDTSSWLSPDLVLATARRSEVVVYAVAVSQRVTEDFLEDLTEATGGRLFKLQSTDKLRATFLQILEEFRHRYLVSFTPRGVRREGLHRLQVRVKGRDAIVRTRAGYLVGS